MRSLVVTVFLLLASMVFAMATHAPCLASMAADHPVWKFSGKVAERGTAARCMARKINGEPAGLMAEPAVTLDDRTEMIEQEFGLPLIVARPSVTPFTLPLFFSSTWPAPLLRPPSSARA